jgi:hypothetical protein
LVNFPAEIADFTLVMTCDLKSVDVALSGAEKEMVTVTMMRLVSVRAICFERTE